MKIILRTITTHCFLFSGGLSLLKGTNAKVGEVSVVHVYFVQLNVSQCVLPTWVSLASVIMVFETSSL